MELTTSDLLQTCCACSSTQGIFNVRCYGAEGNGLTDDLDAILAARDAVNAAGGGVLFFPRGSFVVSDTIELGASTPSSVWARARCSRRSPASLVSACCLRGTPTMCASGISCSTETAPRPATQTPDDENIGCGFLGLPVSEGQTGLCIGNVIVRNHHRSGIRISGPHNSDNPYLLNANEVEVIGCQILDCGDRGVILGRATRARIAGNVITCCTQAGIQVELSRGAVIDGNVIQKTVQRPGTHAGHGIAAANSFDYVIVNNVASENERWGVVASGGVGLWPPDHPMSQRYVVANNVCRRNAAGGITIDPTLPEDHPNHDQIQDAFATVASNVCVANCGPGIRTGNAGYLAVRGNICDGNENDGVAIVSSRYAVVADNVLTGNDSYGVGFFPGTGEGVGHHLLGGNVYDRNRVGEIQIAKGHPVIRELQNRWPGGGAGGMNLPVKGTATDPDNPVEGLFYLNVADSRLRVYANGAWRTLQSTTGTSW